MNPLSVPSSTLSQPITIDLDGDLKIDLMGQTPNPGSGSGSNTFQAWQNVWNSSDPNGQLFSMTTPKFNGAQCALANPHSNAVVDLNGDCLAGELPFALVSAFHAYVNFMLPDIFLVCDDGRGGLSYQIWINNKQDGFTLGAQGSLPSGTQTISFADLGGYYLPLAAVHTLTFRQTVTAQLTCSLPPALLSHPLRASDPTVPLILHTTSSSKSVNTLRIQAMTKMERESAVHRTTSARGMMDSNLISVER
jgi:hypothetical protein